EGSWKLGEDLSRVSLNYLDLVFQLGTFNVLLSHSGVFRVLLDSRDLCVGRAVLGYEYSGIPVEGSYFEDLPGLELHNNLGDYPSLDGADGRDEGSFAHLLDLPHYGLRGV